MSPRPPEVIRLVWTGEGLVFRGGRAKEGSPEIVVDGDGATGPSPMITLLLALAACTGSDVVHILKKMRVGLDVCDVDVTGVRREEEPRRYVAIRLVFRLAGDGLDQTKGERAVSLSMEKYCSVVHSLATDIQVTHQVVVA